MYLSGPSIGQPTALWALKWQPPAHTIPAAIKANLIQYQQQMRRISWVCLTFLGRHENCIPTIWHLRFLLSHFLGLARLCLLQLLCSHNAHILLKLLALSECFRMVGDFVHYMQWAAAFS